MDKVKKYEKIILDLLDEFANFGKPGEGLETQILSNRAHHHYQLLTVGWQGNRKFVYSIALHLSIKNDKIWVLQNNTEAMIADELMERGVPKSDIVLGFHAPSRRIFTGFAVA